MSTTLILDALQFEFSFWRLRSSYLWAWFVVGLLAGWLGGMALGGRRYGCITDIVLGLAGSLLGGWASTNYGFMGGDFQASVLMAAVGGFVLVGLAHLIGKDKK